MIEKYRIYNLERKQRLGQPVEDGMLRKNWYEHPELGKCLFKEVRPTQSIITSARSDWSEKVVNEIGNLLNLPVARYEFATGYFDGSTELIEGIVSLNCIPEGASIFTGEEFLTESGNYDGDDPSQYTIENVLNALDAADVKPPSNWQQIPEIDTGAKLFVGYMMLDCLVNNSDRHDHNWGIMSVGGRLELISSFDHGLSLGSTDEDEGKPDLSLADYVDRFSQSSFQQGYYKLPTFTIFDRAARLYPDAAKIWQQRLARITTAQIDDIFTRIPESRITPIAAKFARQLLEYDRPKILSLDLGSTKTLSQPEVTVRIKVEGIESRDPESPSSGLSR